MSLRSLFPLFAAVVAASCVSGDSSVPVHPIASCPIALRENTIYHNTPIFLCDDGHSIVKMEFVSSTASQRIDCRTGDSFVLHRRGRGPNEYPFLRMLGADREGGFYALTPVANRVIRFDPASGELLETIELEARGVYVANMGERFVVYGDHAAPDRMFTLCDRNGAVVRSFGAYPDDDVSCGSRYKAMAYQGYILTNDSLSRVAFLSMQGDLFVIHDLTRPEESEPLFRHLTEYPDYRPCSDVIGVTYGTYRIRHSDACATTERIYVLTPPHRTTDEVRNETDLRMLEESRRIAVYDWDGNRLCDFEADIPVCNICVSRDGRRMYALYSDEGEIRLCSFDLPAI